MNSDRLKYLIAANKRFCAIGAMEVQSSAVHIPASSSADGILPGSCANNQLLIINLASVQDG